MRIPSSLLLVVAVGLLACSPRETPRPELERLSTVEVRARFGEPCTRSVLADAGRVEVEVWRYCLTSEGAPAACAPGCSPELVLNVVGNSVAYARVVAR